MSCSRLGCSDVRALVAISDGLIFVVDHVREPYLVLPRVLCIALCFVFNQSGVMIRVEQAHCSSCRMTLCIDLWIR